jgi:hypothetical protein
VDPEDVADYDPARRLRRAVGPVLDAASGAPSSRPGWLRLGAVPGKTFTEATTGTNSIATAGETHRGVAVHGEEHYLEAFKRFENACRSHRRVLAVFEAARPRVGALLAFGPDIVLTNDAATAMLAPTGDGGGGDADLSGRRHDAEAAVADLVGIRRTGVATLVVDDADLLTAEVRAVVARRRRGPARSGLGEHRGRRRSPGRCPGQD